MKNKMLEERTIRLVMEYYRNNHEPFFHYADEQILWLGPRSGQMLTSRNELISFFSAARTDLVFEVRGLTAYDVRTGPGRWEIILQFLVMTHFPSGEVHEHNQRMQFSWAKAGKKKADAEDAPDFTVHVLNISNLAFMEEMALYAKSASESAEDAISTTIPTERKHICILQGLGDETHYLSVDEILYLESESRARHCAVHLADPYLPVIHCRESLNQIQEEYPDTFFRSHISYLINPRYVSATSRFQVTLKDGTTLPIPEKKYTAIKDSLRRFLDKSNS